MKKNILFLFILFSKIILACECPTITPVSKELCNNYDVIFFGKVDSVSLCDVVSGATAYFTINELYKGAVQQKLKINFDCSSSCMMSFSKDEEWLIYATYQQFDVLNVILCSHSRKYFNEASQDYYQVQAQRTFEQEKQFLETTLGTQRYPQTNEINQQNGDIPHNEQPGGIYKLGLLLISFATMAIVYFVTRNKNRKNDK
jgi:hypothetical protein